MKVSFGGAEFDAEIFGGSDDCASGCVIRLFNSDEERCFEPLSDLVIVPSCVGFLYLRFIGADAVLSGILNSRCFSKDSAEDIISFLEERFPKLKDTFFPYHIDFAEFIGYDEYNGEY